MRKNIGVLLLGGQGLRFGSKTPKQYTLIKGKPLFTYAAISLTVSERIDSLLYVVPKGYEKMTEKCLHSLSLDDKIMGIIVGGDSRERSAYNALLWLEDKGCDPDSIVLFQDGNRPFLSEELINNNVEKALECGASLTAVSSVDSICLSASGTKVDSYIPRHEAYLLQTPQAFKFGLIFEAFMKAKENLERYTDEGSLLLDNSKVRPAIVYGSPENLKITEKKDLNSFLHNDGSL